MITRRDFLKVTGVAAAAAALTACGGSSSTASSTASSAAASAVAKLDKVKVAVPNDTTNEARALLLLQENGIIKLKDGVGITATKNNSSLNACFFAEREDSLKRSNVVFVVIIHYGCLERSLIWSAMASSTAVTI